MRTFKPSLFLAVNTLTICLLAASCSSSSEDSEWSSSIIGIDDSQYQDNPEIHHGRHSLYGAVVVDSLLISHDEDSRWQLSFLNSDDESRVELSAVHLMEFIPALPNWIKRDPYLTEIGYQNQEFNRQQVSFYPKQISTSGVSMEISRVDVARNCLNSYLWEVFLFSPEDSVDRLLYHGWLEFPRALYQDMFEHRNGTDFARYAHCLEDWTDLEGGTANLDVLREVDYEVSVPLTNHNRGSFRVKGERNKKKDNVIFPAGERKIENFLVDSVKFATFSPPGVYDRSNPKIVDLSKFYKPVSAHYREVRVGESEESLAEIEIAFLSRDGGSYTYLIVGGLDMREIPHLDPADSHLGFQMPMGIANHSFYESHLEAIRRPSKHNPFYALLLDENGQWLDSHKAGVDGPLLHFEAKRRNHLHLWLLSFERHALVGHLDIEL